MDKQHPPVGTYPPDEAAGSLQNIPWQPPPPPDDTKPVKKVGTVTVAIGLIAVGVLMILRLVVPGLDYSLIARFSPLLLVAYGAEILYAGAFAKDKQIKYDLVGLVVSLLLICTSLVAATIPELIVNEREHIAVQRQMRDELNGISHNQLQAAGIDVAELDWYLEPADYNKWNTGTTLDSIDLGSDYLQVRIRFADNFTSEADFAAACREALDAMGIYGQNADYAIFYSQSYSDSYSPGLGNDGVPRFGLWLENTYQVNFSAEQMAAQVETHYWAEEYGWMQADEYAYMLEERAREAETSDDGFEDDVDPSQDNDYEEDDFYDEAA